MFRVFADQADTLWSSLTDQCRQFAHAFNRELGADELRVEADTTTLRAAYPKADTELFVQLDKTDRYVECWLNSGCTTYGSCATDQRPVGLTVKDDALRFVLGGEIVTEEQLAIMLLTQLTSGNDEQQAP